MGGVRVVCTRHRQQVQLDSQGYLRHPPGRATVTGERCDSAEFVIRREDLVPQDVASAFLKTIDTLRGGEPDAR